MGLDNYLIKNGSRDLDMEVYYDLEGLSLCGGMFSGNGEDGSFRGKVYSEGVESETGVSLYEDEIPPETLRLMAEAMIKGSGVTVEQVMESPREHIDKVGDLVVLFAVGAKHGCSLISWY